MGVTIDPTADLVLVVDFGAQYAQLIARRVREAQVYSEIVPHDDRRWRRCWPAARRRSSCPAARPRCTPTGAPQVDPALFDAGVPTFGICYGFQAMAQALGGDGRADRAVGVRPHAAAVAERRRRCSPGCRRQQSVWMSHGDAVSRGAARVRRHRVHRRRARSPRSRTSAAGWPACSSTPRCCTPPHGQEVLERFLYDVAGCRPTWTEANIVEEQVAAIRAQVGGKRVICGLSGGVDSAVAAALVQRAVGDQLTCVFVDHGLLRQGEAEQVEQDFVAATGVRAQGGRRRASGSSAALAGVTDPEEKRKIIGREFIRVFEGAAREVVADADAHGERRVPRAGHALPRRRRVRRRRPARPTSSRTTTSAGCPTTCSSRWSSRCARCSRTRYAGSARELGLPDGDRLAAAVPGPGPGDPDRRRGRPPSGWRCCARPTRSPARS